MIPITNSAEMETNDYELEYGRNCANDWIAYTSSLDNHLLTAECQ